jgi:hypothetical protein
MTPKRYAYIDAIRGYAILLVIAVHSSQYFDDLPVAVRTLEGSGCPRRSVVFRRERDDSLHVMAGAQRRRLCLSISEASSVLLQCTTFPYHFFFGRAVSDQVSTRLTELVGVTS